MDYNTNVKTILPKDVFLLLKKGKNAFPMNKGLDAANFDADVRAWLLDLCKARTETVATSLDFLDTLRRAETVDELSALRAPIVSLRDALVADYQKLLGSVSKAAQHIPNPVLSSMLIGLGVAKSENQYYKQVHDALFGIQRGVEGALTGAVDRIDRLIRNKQNAAMRNARARSNAAAAAQHQARFNTIGARFGLPAGTKPLNVLTTWRNKTVRGGKRKQKKKTHKHRRQRGGQGHEQCSIEPYVKEAKFHDYGNLYTVVGHPELILKEVEDFKDQTQRVKDELENITHAAAHGIAPRVLATKFCGELSREDHSPVRGKPHVASYKAAVGTIVMEKVNPINQRFSDEIKEVVDQQLQDIGFTSWDDNDANYMYGTTASHPDPKWWFVDYGGSKRA